MLRQLSRVASRAAAAQQSALLCAQLQQVPLWHELLQGTRHQASAGCSPKCSRAATQVMQSQWQQQSWRAYQAGYEQSRRRNQKGITDGAMYLVSGEGSVSNALVRRLIMRVLPASLIARPAFAAAHLMFRPAQAWSRHQVCCCNFRSTDKRAECTNE